MIMIVCDEALSSCNFHSNLADLDLDHIVLNLDIIVNNNIDPQTLREEDECYDMVLIATDPQR